jgi:hypothetical protein
MVRKNHKPADLYPAPLDWDNEITKDQIITVKWYSQNNEWWNETCANVVEVFGLPGQRYFYKPYPDFMTFTFKSKKDADLCKVLLSDKIS